MRVHTWPHSPGTVLCRQQCILALQHVNLVGSPAACSMLHSFVATLQSTNKHGPVLCCAVLCRAVLCCAVLCCAVLCVQGQHTHETYSGDRTKEGFETFADSLVPSAGQPHVKHAQLKQAPRASGCNVAGAQQKQQRQQIWCQSLTLRPAVCVGLLYQLCAVNMVHQCTSTAAL
jgi:hypothetical protein